MSSASTHTPTPRFATFADLLLIPEDQRYHEILDGELLRKAAPGGEHSLAHSEIRGALQAFRGRKKSAAQLGGWWILIEPTIELARHEVVQPDLAGWRRENMPEPPSGYPLRLRPDWACEVMADSDARRRDGVQKRRIYADHGVPHYWLIDTERKRLLVLRLEARGYVEVLQAGRGERVRAEPFDAIELSVGVLFGDDPED